MNLIVIGCGRLGAELSHRLFLRGDKVCVVDLNEKAFSNLPVDFRGRTLEGDALSRIVLHRAGIETTDGVAVVTSNDTINAVLGHVAQHFFKVPRVVVRNYAPGYRELHESFGLQMIGSSTWGAQRIEEVLYGQEVRTVFSAGNGEVEVYEFIIPTHWRGKQLAELLPGSGCRVAALTRAGRAILPEMDVVLEEGDMILIGATAGGAEKLQGKLSQRRAEV
jgi:trk system potassium uptake protein TrkA